MTRLECNCTVAYYVYMHNRTRERVVPQRHDPSQNLS